ncbi:hypothetical protein [Gemmata sp.]|uniref:hypothetical protein n=1 Tax=Gemmata sp. TaxID=1914242 RepID=UPI003F7306F4
MAYTRFIGGLDLGQAADFTALIILEQTAAREAPLGPDVAHYAVRHAERFALGTPYTAIVAGLADRFREPPLAMSPLVVDATGVGRPTVDMLRESGIRAAVSPWSITAGRTVGDGTVPKLDLVSAVQTALGTRRLRIAPGLPLAATLAKELESFRVKVTADRNETFSSWRERDHDDLVLALALAVWYGERLGPPVPARPPHVIQVPALWR